jgi:hypothetical protein
MHQNIHYSGHKCPPAFLILNQINPIYTHKPDFSKIQLNILLSSTFRSSELSLYFILAKKKLVRVYNIFHAHYMLPH